MFNGQTYQSHGNQRRHGLFSSSYGFKFVVAGLFLITCFLFYSKHSSNMQLIDEKTSEMFSCVQKKNSLSAQLQVLYDHKSKIEKLLDNQKTDSAKMVVDLKKHIEEAKNNVDIEKNNADDCNRKLGSLQTQLNELKEDRLDSDNKRQSEIDTLKNDLADVHRSLAILKKQKEEAVDKSEMLSSELQKLKTELASCEKKKGETDDEMAQPKKTNIDKTLTESDIKSPKKKTKRDDTAVEENVGQVPRPIFADPDSGKNKSQALTENTKYTDGEQVVFKRSEEDKKPGSLDGDNGVEFKRVKSPAKVEHGDNAAKVEHENNLEAVPDQADLLEEQNKDLNEDEGANVANEEDDNNDGANENGQP